MSATVSIQGGEGVWRGFGKIRSRQAAIPMAWEKLWEIFCEDFCLRKVNACTIPAALFDASVFAPANSSLSSWQMQNAMLWFGQLSSITCAIHAISAVVALRAQRMHQRCFALDADALTSLMTIHLSVISEAVLASGTLEYCLAFPVL